MANKVPCPFCDEKVVSNWILGHILSKHEEEAITYNPSVNKTKSMSNLYKLRPGSQRDKPVYLRFPKDQDYYCCFGCKTAFKRDCYCANHQKCKDKHHSRVQELYEKYEEQPTAPVALGAVATVVAPVAVEIDWTPHQKELWRIIKSNWSYRYSADIRDKHMEWIEDDIGDEEGATLTISKKYLDERRPIGVDGVYLQQLREKYPFDCSLETLIDLCEKGENKELWLSRIPPTKKPQKSAQ